MACIAGRGLQDDILWLLNGALAFYLFKMFNGFALFIPGYILDISGPYMGANSDSQIMKQIADDARNAARNVMSWMNPDDIFLVDRGFFDCLDILRDMGFKVQNHDCYTSTFI